ncbi:MAG: oxygenase MpaB family protein [Myxococcales bacterium]
MPQRSDREISREALEARLKELAGTVSDPARALAPPGSVAWTVASELVLHLAGPRALLMQFAHPLVAQGVADHSRFREDLLGRARRTFGAVYRMTFGPAAEALDIARAVHAGHARVRGTLPSAAGCHPAGAPYAANDPRLLAWVWATLVDSGLWAYERWVAPLSPADRERWYVEHLRLAALFGLGPGELPLHHRAFRDWMDRWLDGPELALSEAGRELCRIFLAGAGVPGAGPLFTLLAAGTLPPRLRDELALPWGPAARASFAAFSAAVTAAVRLTPPPLRRVPIAWNRACAAGPNLHRR